MTAPPEPILEAALLTLHRALVYARNVSLRPDAEAAKQVEALMEALHEIPDFLSDWPRHSLDELRLHLRCFDHTRWPGAPDFVAIFDERLDERSRPNKA